MYSNTYVPFDYLSLIYLTAVNFHDNNSVRKVTIFSNRKTQMSMSGTLCNLIRM